MKGEILMIAHRLPYPPDRGDRLRAWQVLQALARIAPTHVVASVDRAADRVHEGAVARVAASVTTAVRGGHGGAMVRALATGAPASVALFHRPVLQRAVDARLRGGRIGTAYAFSGQSMAYLRHARVRTVLDLVDVDSAKFEAQAIVADGVRGWALGREARRLAVFERAAATTADATLLVSAEEAALFTARTGLPATVVGNGVDAYRFAPDAVAPVPVAGPLIVFTGQMDYAPNVQAVEGFVREVLPQVPGAHFAIVGRAPTPAVRALAGPRVTVTGEVADTRPWLAAATLAVAPLTLARGVQNKVLEAMAMALPVVASPAAAEGIAAVDGAEVVVANGPAATAAAVNGLLGDPTTARAIGTAARACVLARYGWDAQLAPLKAIVDG